MFKNQLARSGLGFYFPVRFLFQQQTCHLSLLVHGIEPTIEAKGEQTLSKSDTENKSQLQQHLVRQETRNTTA